MTLLYHCMQILLSNIYLLYNKTRFEDLNKIRQHPISKIFFHNYYTHDLMSFLLNMFHSMSNIVYIAV